MADFDTRQQLIAQRLRNYGDQSQYQAPQGRMAGRIYVAPNALEYLAAGVRSLGGQRGQQLATQELGELQKERQQAEIGDIEAFTRQLRGTPARTIQPATPNDDEGNPMPAVNVAAQPGNTLGAYQALAGSQSPALRQAGLQGMVSTAQTEAAAAQKLQEQQRVLGILAKARSPQEALSMGVPPELVKQFAESPNWGRAKVDFKDVGGQLVPVTEFGDRPKGVADLEKTGDPYKDILVRGPDGKIGPNMPFVNAKSAIAAAGRPQTNVNVNMPDKKFYEGLGTSVAGRIEQDLTQAQSAAQTLSNANLIASSLDKAVVGPLANQRVAVARLGEVLGVTGKDTKEMLQNTRNVVQGLARQELAAAGQMKGQGQITESERGILRRAEAGEIENFTKPELETFIGAVRKTSRARIAAHERNVQNLSSDPQAATMLPYLRVDVPEDVPVGVPRATPAPGSGFRIIGVQ